jgi:predicted component of type VI protein secretion system
MSNDQSQRLFDQLMDENPKVRIKAIRGLAAIAEVEAISDLSAIYNSQDEPLEVKQAAKDALGVFRALQVAMDADPNFELPVSAGAEPRFSPDLLQRLLTILVVVLVVIDIVLVVRPDTSDQQGIAAITGDPPSILAQMRVRLSQLQTDVSNQRQSWEQFRAIGTLGCDNLPQPAGGSINASDLMALTIDPVQYPDLQQANAAMIGAINQFVLVNNDRVLGCSAGQPSRAADQNLTMLDTVSAQLTQASLALDSAAAAMATLTPAGPTLEPGTPFIPTATLAEGQVLPTAEASPLPAVDYTFYIREMRGRIDFVKTGRGAATLLSQYWQDVVNTGQSFGCRQLLSDEGLENYTGITAEIAGLDPRLNEVQVALNVGLTFLRQARIDFLAGCNAGTFASVVNMGQQEIQQAVVALNQASAMLDRLQAEVTGH